MENINWNELIDRAYQNAVNHGWHEEPYSVEHYLMLVITELSESVNADRSGLYADRLEFEKSTNKPAISDEYWKYCFEDYIKDTVEDELADAAIRFLDFAGVHDYQIDRKLFKEEAYAESSKELEKCSFTKIIFCVIMSFNDVRTNISSILYFLFAIAWHYKIDLLWHIEQKMKYNEMRPYKHGKKY